MKAHGKLSAVLVLTLAALAAAPVGMAWGQPYERRAERRAEGRSEGRGQPRGEGPRGEGPRGEGSRGEQRELRDRPGAYRGPVYAAPPPSAYPYGAYPAPSPPAYAPAPGYSANSLGPGWAQQQNQARRGVREGGMRSLGGVVAQLKRSTPGRLLDAGIEPGPDGRPAYRVRWAAANGQRIDFIVDAATGQIIGRSGY